MVIPHRRHLFALLVSVWMPLSSVAGGTVNLATHDQPPYGTYLPDGTFDGIAYKVVRCALIKMGRPFNIEVFPWKRAQVIAETGNFDGFFPATLKPEREVWTQASVEIAEQQWVWYLKAGSKLDPKSPEFKATATVGAHMGSNRLDFLEKGGYQVVLRSYDEAMLFNAFVQGRADAVLVGNLSAAEIMKSQKLDPKQFKVVLEADKPLYAFFAKRFVKENPGFMEHFNAEVPKCR